MFDVSDYYTTFLPVRKEFKHASLNKRRDIIVSYFTPNVPTVDVFFSRLIGSKKGNTHTHGSLRLNVMTNSLDCMLIQ